MPTPVSDLKRVVYLRGLLDGRRWHTASSALEFAIWAHGDQMRKDGVTPFVLHPIEVALYLVTLSASLDDPEGTVTDALLHDTVEDCPQVDLRMIEDNFGEASAETVLHLSAPPGETPQEKHARFSALARLPRGGPIKLSDRGHNLFTMLGAFRREQVEKYILETEEYFFPLAREARRALPSQSAVYLNLKTAIQWQLRPLQALLDTPGSLAS